MENATHCFVKGRVQGVCFRMATRQKAVLLGLTGWVRNLDDGRVEVFACGSKQKLDDLRLWLSKGPEAAHVLNVASRVAQYEQMESFEIR